MHQHRQQHWQLGTWSHLPDRETAMRDVSRTQFFFFVSFLLYVKTIKTETENMNLWPFVIHPTPFISHFYAKQSEPSAASIHQTWELYKYTHLPVMFFFFRSNLSQSLLLVKLWFPIWCSFHEHTRHFLFSFTTGLLFIYLFFPKWINCISKHVIKDLFCILEWQFHLLSACTSQLRH